MLNRVPVYLIELGPLDSSGVIQPYYLATRDIDFDLGGDVWQQYRGCVKDFSIERTLFDGDRIGGKALPDVGDIKLIIDDWIVENWQSDWDQWGWGGAGVRVLYGFLGDAIAAYEVIFVGTCEAGPKLNNAQATIPVKDLRSKLERVAFEEKYAGTGGFEGEADLEGVYKTVILGFAKAVSPVVVDDGSGVTWYDVAPVFGVNAGSFIIYDGGKAISSHPTYPPAAGTYYADYPNGRFCLGTKPVKKLVASCIGLSPEVGGGLSFFNIGGLHAIRSLTYLADLDFDLASFIEVNPIAAGSAIQFDIRSGEDFIDLFDGIIATTDCFCALDGDGTVRVGLIESPPDIDVEAADHYFDDSNIDEGSLEVGSAGVPASGVKLGFDYTSDVHSLTDFVEDATNSSIQNFSFPFKYKELASAAAVVLANPTSTFLERDTRNQLEANTDVLLARLVALFGVERKIGRLSTEGLPSGLRLFGSIGVRSEIEDVDDVFRIVGWRSSIEAGQTDIYFWG